jgi:hypothetical protein
MWPWLLMPLIVLAAFYGLYHLHQRPAPAGAPPPAASAPGG